MSWRFQRRHKPDAVEAEGLRALRAARFWCEPIEGRPGLPDVLVCRDGKAVLIEFKSKYGRRSEEQVTFQNFWHGCPIIVARSGEEAVKLCEEACR